MTKPIAIIMGSDSDLEVMSGAATILKDFDVDFHMEVVSAHRSPEKMQEFALSAKENGYQVIIAGAGGAAHLPGMVASLTTLPVVGVPVALKHLDGMDSILSILQMPKGVPVATVAVNNSQNAALLALRILAVADQSLNEELEKFRVKQKEKVEKMNRDLSKKLK